MDVFIGIELVICTQKMHLSLHSDTFERFMGNFFTQLSCVLHQGHQKLCLKD